MKFIIRDAIIDCLDPGANVNRIARDLPVVCMGNDIQKESKFQSLKRRVVRNLPDDWFTGDSRKFWPTVQTHYAMPAHKQTVLDETVDETTFHKWGANT
jgi:hypothetical protein